MIRSLPELRHEPLEQRVRAVSGDDAVVDSTRAVLVWEPRRVVPSYAVPEADIRAELAPAPAEDAEVAGVLHPGIPFAVHTAPGETLAVGGREGAGFRLADADLPGYVALDFRAFDRWYEEDEPVVAHPREPYHRVDVRRTSRPVAIELDGELLAETTRARFVFETFLPMRIYVPREDVAAPLHAGSRHTHCPYKGEATCLSVEAGGRRHEDLGWSYEHPLAEVGALAGLVAFWDERVDVRVDGRPRPRPGGPFSEALVDEFAV
jgi:uncharacterized protein (DUF427 family)